jgi:hypothetical protein
VGEHHVGDCPGQLAEFRQRRQDVFPVRDHARVDDHVVSPSRMKPTVLASRPLLAPVHSRCT